MPRLPFNHSPRLAARFARLHRLKRKGMTPATDKASLRQAASEAFLAAGHITADPVILRSDDKLIDPKSGNVLG